MKKIYLIFALLINFCCINKSYCQKIVNLGLISAKSLNLKNFAKIEIINNLPDSNILGYFPSDVMNDRKFIKSSGAITPWLQDFVNKQFVSNTDIKAKKLLWVIQDLSMGTDSTQKQVYSFVKLKGDIYESSGLNYQLINTFDSSWIIKGDADFGYMIAVAFLSLYQNSTPKAEGIANTRFFQMSQKAQGTVNEIAAQIKTAKQLPVLQTDIHPTGIYTSFEEFKNNTPSIKNFYADVDSQSKKVQLYQVSADSSSKLIEKAWGISVNNELYYYDEGQLYPIEKSGNTFYMAKYLEPSTRKNQAFYWRQIIGARQGDTNPYNDAHVLRKNVSTTNNISLEATHLDFDKEDFIY